MINHQAGGWREEGGEGALLQIAKLRDGRRGVGAHGVVDPLVCKAGNALLQGFKVVVEDATICQKVEVVIEFVVP